MSLFRFLRRRPKGWAEATTHEISILSGGWVLHHSFCWCKVRLLAIPEKQDSK